MNGARVRQVRELLGWTQTQLADAASIRQPQVSAIESEAPAPPGVIEAIALATGFPQGWFDEEPYVQYAKGTIRYRKGARASQRDDQQAVRRLEVATEVASKLARGLRIPAVALPHLGDSGDIEAAAATTRDALELPSHGPVRNLIRAIERAGALVVGLPVALGGPQSRLQHHHGVSAWPDKETSRPTIGFSTADPGDRQRHTVAHEVGHLVLHSGPAEKSRDYEREASQFAAALLMPYDDARAAFARGVTLQSLAKLKAAWGISIAGLAMRARQVDAISSGRLESLFKQISARGWRRAEPVTVHREEPALIPRLLEAGYGKPIDWRGAAAALNVPPHLLREVASVAGRDRTDTDEAHSSVITLSAHRVVGGAAN